MSNLKQLGNQAFLNGDLKQALNFYTQALDCPPPTETLSAEQKRVILSNRAQTYLDYTDVYDALQDCNVALSPEYTKEDSPRALTAKLHLRRAKALFKLLRYADAREAFQAFEGIHRDLGYDIRPSERTFANDIDRALRMPLDDPRTDKIGLARTVIGRGMIIQERDMSNFPSSPSGGPDDEDMVTGFDMNYPGRTNRMEDVPLSVLFNFRMPFLQDLTSPNQKFGGKIPIPEYATLGEAIENMLGSLAIGSPVDLGAGRGRDWLRQAVAYYSNETSTIVLVTHHGRFSAIPHSMKVGDIWPEARWPRQTPSPLRDLRKTPRQRPHEIDGVGFCQGYTVDLMVLPNDRVQSFVDDLDSKFRLMGM
ncbi:unnamed protein product [Somion occarium]|uniref:Uncharacterized protein n=1 Tax=Somion occarium TaxID=3059160 RepID=A0ABP1DV61_9APHY